LEESVFEDVSERRRFELRERGMTAFANYRRENDRLVIPHVESPPPLHGKGTAGRLMTAIVDYARHHQFKITPLCPYALSWFRRHPEYGDVLS